VKLQDHFTMCWRQVLRNRRRYKAVIAAIAFGTAGFIVIRTMGDSVERRLGENLELLGEATVMMADWDNHEENVHPGRYYMRDVHALRQLPNIVAAAPLVTLPSVKVGFGVTEWYATLLGIDQAYWKTQTPKAKSGRLIGPSDIVGRRRVCVVGNDVVHYLFGGKDPVGQSIMVNNHSFRVIGALGGIQAPDIKAGVMVPITTAQSLFPGLDWIKAVYLRADNWNTVEQARAQSMELLKMNHKGFEQGLQIIYFPDRVARVQTLVNLVKLFVYASLVVVFVLGKVGLTNVMLAAVQDRTREIGLRKALGAKEEAIRVQFLSESVLISLIAGSFGVLTGLALVFVLKGRMGFEISNYVMSVSILIDLVFTVSIGVFAGLFPSLQASRLDVVTAMRFE
jgi:putative ABC transport system permease protein